MPAFRDVRVELARAVREAFVIRVGVEHDLTAGDEQRPRLQQISPRLDRGGLAPRQAHGTVGIDDDAAAPGSVRLGDRLVAAGVR